MRPWSSSAAADPYFGAAAELLHVGRVHHLGGRPVRGADVERGGPAGELRLQLSGARGRGVEAALRVGDAGVRFVDLELGRVVLLVEDRDAHAVGVDLRLELGRLGLLLGELVLG